MRESSANVLEAVVKLFEQAGYDVSQSVGVTPGSVNWFATRRAGFDRTKTYFEVWREYPVDVIGAEDKLENTRIDLGADRALAIVDANVLPADYEPDLAGWTAHIISFRHFVIGLSGLEDSIRMTVQYYQSRGTSLHYFPYRCKTADGKIVDAVEYIDEWIQSERSKTLALTGSFGRAAVIDEVAYRLGKRFLEEPATVTPLIESDGMVPMAAVTVALGYAVVAYASGRGSLVLGHGRSLVVAFNADDAKERLSEHAIDEFIELIPPTHDEFEQWFLDRIPAGASSTRFHDVWQKVSAFRSLVIDPRDLVPLLEGIKAATLHTESGMGPEWIAHVVSKYVESSLELGQNATDAKLSADLLILEDTALEQFALGESAAFDRMYDRGTRSKQWATLSQWVERTSSDRANRKHRFVSDLLCHYFLARKIIREIQAGAIDIATRYQFPREYVLLFIGILSPDTLARLSDDRSALARQQIEQEVERRVELTAAHALNRTVGALSTHVQRIRRRLDSETLKSLEYEFQRIDAEIEYQRNLIERTRRLEGIPEIVPESVDVNLVVKASVERLQETYSTVALFVEVEPELRIRATTSFLREVIDCLLENACQALTTSQTPSSPEVHVLGRVLGDTVRIDVVDNGPGIPLADRERIFQPYVTTKKGGEGKPLGTGMGLPIARRYATRVGGKVDIDPTHEKTCFFALFVRWKEFS